MRNESKHGILVVGHGSRREEANRDVLGVAKLIGERGGFRLVEAAFLEIESPDITEGFNRLVERGADSITVHPYFLSPGRHTRGDVPRKVAEASALHPTVRYQITEPLSAHQLVIEASIERIRETQCPPHMKRQSSLAAPGMVYLVGAGPGDPGLLTLRAAKLLRSSDVVIYDYLVNVEVLGHASENTKRIYVGKIGGGKQTPQPVINRLLIEHARRGKRVIRLKGGDPFIFGRGGEEADALRTAGIEFEIVPGISSALAAPAYAGIPLTHRGLSSSVAIVTGAKASDGSANLALLNSLAKGADTLVILMGFTRLREIADELIGSGRIPETPAAVITWGTYKTQKTITGTLKTIADEAERAGLSAPSVIVVGDVVSLHRRLNWFETNSASFRFKENLELATAATV